MAYGGVANYASLPHMSACRRQSESGSDVDYGVGLSLAYGADANITSPPRMSAYRRESSNCVEYVVKLSMASGADANTVSPQMSEDRTETTDRYGCTALHMAVLRMRYREYSSDDVVSTIRSLLNHGGENPNALNGDGVTAMYLACSSPPSNEIGLRYSVVQLLLQSGANPNFFSVPEQNTEINSSTQHFTPTYCRSDCRISPLSYAARHNDVTLMELLLKFGAQLELKDPSGKTALYYALEPAKRNSSSYKTASLQLLLKSGAKVNVLDDTGVSPLASACSEGVSVLVKTLLSFGADPNLPTTAVYPLSLACQFRYYEIVELLLEYGADMQATNSNSEPPLCEALTTFDDGDAGPDSDLAQLLLDYGADTNVMTSLGETPLILACLNNLPTVVWMMLKCGAKVNIGKSHKSPLNDACRNKHMVIVELLLNEGADPNVPEETADTCSYALHIAVNDGNHDPFGACDYGDNDLYRTCGPRSITATYGCSGNNDLVNLLLRHGANVDVVDGFGNTALHHVMKTCNRSTRESILDTLLKAGADVNICNNDGESPLYLAVQKCLYTGLKKCDGVRDYAVTNLLAHGADPNLTTTDKFPLSVACDIEMQNFSLVTVDTLLEAGANPNLTAANTDSCYSGGQNGAEAVITCELPLCIAVKKNDQKLVELLLNSGAKVNVLNSRGNSALHCAIENMVSDHQDDPAVRDLDRLARYKTMHPNAYDYTEMTVITKVARLVKLLLEHGADVNQMMPNGSSPLSLLLNYYNVMPLWVQCKKLVDETVKIMISEGANLADSSNNLGHDFGLEELTILRSLCAWRSTDHVAVDLLQAGAGFKLLAYYCMRRPTSRIMATSVHMCQAAVLAGYVPSSDELADMYQSVYDEDIEPKYVELLSWLNEDRQQVPSLMRQCRVAIRRQLSVSSHHRTILPAIDQLPLPSRLKLYLKFEGSDTEIDLIAPMSDDDESNWTGVLTDPYG